MRYLVLIVLLCGCATTKTEFAANLTYHEDGTPASDSTSFTQKNAVTWGSELPESAGKLGYIWSADGSGSIAVGSEVQGMKAGTVDIAAITSMIAPFLAPGPIVNGQNTPSLLSLLMDMLTQYRLNSVIAR